VPRRQQTIGYAESPFATHHHHGARSGYLAMFHHSALVEANFSDKIIVLKIQEVGLIKSTDTSSKTARLTHMQQPEASVIGLNVVSFGMSRIS
jgi:hypothetical protein